MQRIVGLVRDHVVLEQDPRPVLPSIAIVSERFIEQTSERRRVVQDEWPDEKAIGLKRFHAVSLMTFPS